MTNPGDPSNEPPTATATAQASTPPVSGQAPRPSVAVEVSTTTTTAASVTTTAVSPMPSVTRAPPTVVAAGSPAARHFVCSTGSEEPPGGGGGRDSGGGAVAVSAGMAVLNIGPNSTDRVKAGIGGRSSRVGIRLGQRKRTRDQGHVAGGSGGERESGSIAIPVCRSDEFPSFQSLSGDMESHPESDWRGVSPRLTFSPDEFGDNLAQVGGGGTGEVAESAAMAGGGDVAGAVGREASEAAVTVAETAEGKDGNLAALPVFDLNKLPEKEEVEPSSGKLDWDLNKTPSPGAAP